MARLIPTLVFACAFACNAFSQTTKWFEDNFDDRSKGWSWSDFDGPDVSRKIENGVYYIDHKNTAGMIYWTMNSMFNDPSKPFMIETNFTMTAGNGGNGAGIIISGRDSKYYYFIIDPVKQQYWVGSEQKGTWKTYNPYEASNYWQGSQAIQPLGEANNLKVLKNADNITFTINGQAVFRGPLQPDFAELPGSSYMGIVTCTVMKIEVDNFVYYQDSPPINVVAGLPRLTKVNIGDQVNSRYTEKMPYIAPDGKTLYYVVQGDPENKGTDKTDEIYFATSHGDGTWSPRQNVGWPLNNEWPNCVISATPDNNTLYLMHTYNNDGSPKASGFSVTHKTASGWSVPTDLRVKNYYNRAGTNEFCFSSDRKVLIMAIKRDDTYGDNDIYASFLEDTGEFSEPINLGPVVNTFAWEASPFLAPDGITLYYSTAGYPGYGNNDIFMTQRLDSTWQKWSTPVNMGPDINTAEWDAYYTAAASGTYAYVISTKNSIENSLDIFQIQLPDALKPKPVVLVYGKVLNSKTKEPLASDINYSILSTNKEVGIASSNFKDGSYKIVLPAGEVYSFLAHKLGYFSVSENIDLNAIESYREIERDLYLAPIETGGAIRLNNLFFDFNKYVLRKESVPELARVMELLTANPEMTIEIGGHTDNVGSDDVNNKLSNERALAVKNYLLSKGIDAQRVSSKGYGKTKPVSNNDSDEGRQRNRRVEFTILSK